MTHSLDSAAKKTGMSKREITALAVAELLQKYPTPESLIAAVIRARKAAQRG